ncbi:phage tail protein [Klebsiella aerogenes]
MNTDLLSLFSSNLTEQVENYLDEMPPLLMWGDFIFQLSTMAYSKLTRQDSWNWAAQGRFSRPDKLQYVGKKRPTIQLECEIYSQLVNKSLLTMGLEYAGVLETAETLDPVDILRLQAETRTPMMLVEGTGRVMGFWVMTAMTVTVDEFKSDGQAKHQTVSVTLQHYGPRLADGDQVPDYASLGFTTKSTKIQSALDEVESFIKEYTGVELDL